MRYRNAWFIVSLSVEWNLESLSYKIKEERGCITRKDGTVDKKSHAYINLIDLCPLFPKTVCI